MEMAIGTPSITRVSWEGFCDPGLSDTLRKSRDADKLAEAKANAKAQKETHKMELAAAKERKGARLC